MDELKTEIPDIEGVPPTAGGILPEGDRLSADGGSPILTPVSSPAGDDRPVEPLPVRQPSPTDQTPTAGQMPTAGRTPTAGFMRRGLAFMIDFIFLECLYGILASFGFLGLYLSKGEVPDLSSLIAPFVSIWFVLFIGYFTFFHAHSGKTPAKQIIRIKVVHIEGMPLSHWMALWRSCVSLFSFIFFIFGFLFAMFGKKKQGLHDMLARSYVVLD